MTLAQYLRVIREQWRVVVALTLLALAGAGAYTWLQTPSYQAKAQLFVSVNGRDVSEVTQGGSFTQQRVKSYADIVNSTKIVQTVINELKLPYTVEKLRDEITTSSPLDTVLLDITVEDPSAERARDIANAVANEFPRLVTQIETPRGGTASPVTVAVTESASLPEHPVSPRVPLNLALGLLVGLGLGVGVAVLRESLDRTVGTRHNAAEIADAPVLAVFVEDARARDHALIAREVGSQRAEAFRQLRTNIRFLSIDTKVRSLVVTGSLPGEGKTTTAANLALSLAMAGDTVVLVDADLRKPSIADLFGLPGGVGLTNVLLGDVTLEAALLKWRQDVPLHILTSGPVPPNPSELLGSARLEELVKLLVDRGATVIFDSPPLLPVTDAAILGRVTDGALVVTRVGSTRADQLANAVGSLRTAGATVLGVVLNHVPERGRNSYDSYGNTATYESYGVTAADATVAPADTAPSTSPRRRAAAGAGSRRATPADRPRASRAGSAQYDQAERNGAADNGTDYNGTAYNGTAYNGTAYNETQYNGTEYDGTDHNSTDHNGTEYDEIEYPQIEHPGTPSRENEYAPAEEHQTAHHPHDADHTRDIDSLAVIPRPGADRAVSSPSAGATAAGEPHSDALFGPPPLTGRSPAPTGDSRERSPLSALVTGPIRLHRSRNRGRNPRDS